MSLTEKIQLFGNYDDIPNILTLSPLSSILELDLVSNEDYDNVMLNDIFPKVISESIDFTKLLEIDYQWICRCLRIHSYGNSYRTNTIFCNECKQQSKGEYEVNLETVNCKTLPLNYQHDILIDKINYIEFDLPIHIHMLTISEVIDLKNSEILRYYNEVFARICYMIDKIGDVYFTNNVDIADYLISKLIPADYEILKMLIKNCTSYGLDQTGLAQCPKCRSLSANFFISRDDRFFVRPWELTNDNEYRLNGKHVSERELRQRLYENIIDEAVFISRASEGAISTEWIMQQPVFIRNKYVESFKDEIKERQKSVNKSNK